MAGRITDTPVMAGCYPLADRETDKERNRKEEGAMNKDELSGMTGTGKTEDQAIEAAELAHLEEILKIAGEELSKSEIKKQRKQEEILEAKKEQRENTVHGLGNLYSKDGFEELVELSQYAQQISLQLDGYEHEEKKIQRLKRILKSPYFARIDFQFQGDPEPEQIYIGRFVLTGDKEYDIKVYDWRSPVASVFYQYGIGAAAYEAPSGTIHGQVCLKRQYEIKEGKLLYYFDSETEIMDEYLKQMLAQNASKTMHAIVETIQRDQDVVIRDMKSELMMVQGVAGSGKTSVALHRAAYLMYQGMSDQLQADHILIISPNSLFEQYISRVLPELGEDNVVSCLFEDILDQHIQPKRLQSYRQYLEYAQDASASPERRKQKEKSFTCKTAGMFLDQLKKFGASEGEEKSVRTLYIQLLEKNRDHQPEYRDIFEYTLENMESRTLFYEDALCICYLQMKVNGVKADGRIIRHVIIDEVQDYTPLHFEILKLLYPAASFTILGDIHQALGSKVSLSFYDEIKRILGRPGAALVKMNKSFRCSRQILEFSAGFLEEPEEVESFCRDGDEPTVVTSESREELEQAMVKEIKNCLDKGLDSVALICDNQKNADQLCKRLKKLLSSDIGITAVSDNGESPEEKVFTIPLYMAKGLEFDGVLICDIYKKQHLYIAATRALHRVSRFSLDSGE